MNNIISKIPGIEFIGKFKDKVDFFDNFERRLYAFDYSGEFETFMYKISIFEEITENSFVDKLFNHRFNEPDMLESASQKLTQLLLLIEYLKKQYGILQKQIKSSNKKYELNDNFTFLITQIESLFFLNSSVLDLMSKFYSKFVVSFTDNRVKPPEKYGQQKAWDKQKNSFNYPFDSELQEKQKCNTVINICHDYRNSFSHETCLKLLPIEQSEGIKLFISKGDTIGINLLSIIEKLPIELLDYINYYKHNLIEKINNSCG